MTDAPHPALLASAAHDVKLWRMSQSKKTYTHYATFDADTTMLGGINAIAWGQQADGTTVVGTVSKNVAAIYDAKGNRLEAIPPSADVLRTDELNALQLVDRGTGVVTAGTNKVVRLWDRQAQAYTEALQGHTSAILCLAASHEQSALLIASGSAGGDVLVHTRSSRELTVLDVPTSTLPMPRISQLHFNYFIGSQLAAATSTGDVLVWDVAGKSSNPILSFKQLHSGAITGLAHTTLNKQLLVCAGIDRRISVLDVTGGKRITDFVLDQPLTCLAYRNDGMTLAVGTSSGRVGLFDIRHPTRELSVFTAHEPHAVRAISFQELPRASKSSTTTSSSSARNSMSSSTNTRPQSLNGQAPLAAAKAPTRRASDRDLSTSGKTSSTLAKTTRDSLGAVPISSVQAFTTPTALLRDRRDTLNAHMDIFSPLQGQAQGKAGAENTPSPSDPVQPALGVDVFSPLQPSDKLSSTSPPPPQSAKRVLFAPTTKASQSTELGPSSLPPEPVIRKSTSASSLKFSASLGSPSSSQRFASSAIDNRSTPPSKQQQQPPTAAPDSISPARPPPKPFASLSSTTASSSSSSSFSTTLTATSTANTTASDGAGSSRLPLASATPRSPVLSAQPSAFSTQLLENLIDDAMQSFRESVRNDIQNVHLELLRQFEIQKLDLREMFAEYLKVKEVMEENERLREENKRLRCNF
ncbi:hypothetical protein RI367_005503 [Sorochytrium milnesiophthora]